MGEVAELTVDPGHTRQGHGSRLVQACADTLRADRFRTAVVWLTSEDDARRGFLTEAGWDPDGAHRELDLHGDGSVRVKQVRLHTDLTEDAPGLEDHTAGHDLTRAGRSSGRTGAGSSHRARRTSSSGGLVLGPLPLLYRWVVSVLAVIVCAGLGAWLAWTLPVALLVQTGAVIGAALGVLLVGLLLHDNEPPAERVRRRQH